MAERGSDTIRATKDIVNIMMLVSIVVYCFVMYTVVKKLVFSYTFTLVSVYLAVADIMYAVAFRLLIVVPNKNWLR